MVEWRFAICIDRRLVVLIELVFGFRLFGVMYAGLLVVVLCGIGVLCWLLDCFCCVGILGLVAYVWWVS